MTTPQLLTSISDPRYRAAGQRRLAQALGGLIAVHLVNLARRNEREADKLESELPPVVLNREGEKT